MAEIAPDNKSSNSRATAAKMKVKQDKRSTTFQQAQAARNAAPTSDEPRRPSSNTTMAPDGSAKNAHGSSEAAPSTPCRDYSSSVSAETPKVQPTSAASPFRPILTSMRAGGTPYQYAAARGGLSGPPASVLGGFSFAGTGTETHADARSAPTSTGHFSISGASTPKAAARPASVAGSLSEVRTPTRNRNMTLGDILSPPSSLRLGNLNISGGQDADSVSQLSASVGGISLAEVPKSELSRGVCIIPKMQGIGTL